MVNKYLIRLVAPIIALILTGCATYQQPPADRTEPAPAKISSPRAGGLDQIINVVQVDHQDTVASWKVQFIGYPNPVLVEPGKRDLKVRCRKGDLVGEAEIWLVAEPGASYIVKAKTIGYRIIVWAEDEATGKETGGVKGSDDEPK